MRLANNFDYVEEAITIYIYPFLSKHLPFRTIVVPFEVPNSLWWRGPSDNGEPGGETDEWLT